MKPGCEHKAETLIHGLITLLKAEGRIVPGVSYFGENHALGLLEVFADHEAQEVGLGQEALALRTELMEKDQSRALDLQDIQRVRREFTDRALKALLECECAQG